MQYAYSFHLYVKNMQSSLCSLLFYFVKMMFNSLCQFTWCKTCVFLFLVLYNFTPSTGKLIPHFKECAPVVPVASSKSIEHFSPPYLRTLTSYFDGVERILGKNSSNSFYTLQFDTSRNVSESNIYGIYKMDAELTFEEYSLHHSLSESSYGRPSHRHTRSGTLKFLFHGFWLESSGTGCFKGSASWRSINSSKDKPLNLQAILMINYSRSSTYLNSFLSAKLESLSSMNDEHYFEPISILSFPRINQYEYKLVSPETVRDFHVVDDIQKTSRLSSRLVRICSLFSRQYVTFKLEYAISCSSSSKNCAPLDGVLGYRPAYISLYIIERCNFKNKMRFLVKLTKRSIIRIYEMFHPNTTLMGEGWWDEKTNRLLIVACRISSSSTSEVAHVEDCSFRLSLWFPSVWSITYRISATGLIWTNKTAEDAGYFSRIKFRTSDKCMNIPGLKYKYTEIDNVRKLCPKKAVKRRERYPSGQSNHMRLEMSVLNSKYFGWSSAEPIIGRKKYGYSPVIVSSSSWGGYAYAEPEADVNNVSNKLNFWSVGDVKLEAGYSSLNQSFDSDGQLEISAEGIYDARTGFLCMVGCRILDSFDSLDCGISLNFQFPGLSVSSGGFIKGSMKSTRKQSDPLFFGNLDMISNSFSGHEARRSVWRIDLEIAMVLISNTLSCAFVCFQLYYVRRYPKCIPYMSLLMVVILTLGYMISLVLNFKSFVLQKQNKQNTMLSSTGWLEVDDVIVRVITMVAFVLQCRLLQVVWRARLSAESNECNEGSISGSEKKALLVSLPIYIVGGLIAFLVKCKKSKYGNASCAFIIREQQHMLWGALRSYAGVILDGFLFPQVLLYLIQVPSESALSRPFYLGTTSVTWYLMHMIFIEPTTMSLSMLIANIFMQITVQIFSLLRGILSFLPQVYY